MKINKVIIVINRKMADLSDHKADLVIAVGGVR